MAARLGDDDLTLVAWPWPQRQVDAELDRVVVADGVGIVVGLAGQLAWVRRDDCTVTDVGGDLTLAAADPDAAWLADRSFVDPGTPSAPPPPLPPGRIVAARRDGSSTQVTTPAPVKAIGLRGADVWVTVSEPPRAHQLGRGAWTFEYPSSILRVNRDRLLADGLAGATPATGDIPATNHSRSRSSMWLEDAADTVLRYGLRIGGLIWWVGARHDRDKIDRQIMAVGHDPDSGRPSVRVDLGRGLAGDAQAIGEELWLTVARRRFFAVPHDRGVDVLAVSASGAVRIVHRADSIDISRFAPVPRRPPEEEIHEHIEKVRHQFDHLENFWRSPDGATSPLSDGLSEASVSLDGEWRIWTPTISRRATKPSTACSTRELSADRADHSRVPTCRSSEAGLRFSYPAGEVNELPAVGASGPVELTTG